MSHGFLGCSKEYQLKNLIWLFFLAFLLLHSYAAFSLLAYYADSAYYFFKILTTKSFELGEPASLTVQFVQQLPLLLALNLGVSDVNSLSLVFGFTLLLVPLTLLLLCYTLLPIGNKSFIIFPLLAFLIGTEASFFSVVTELPIATGYFWVLFYLVLFQSNKTSKIWGIIILSMPAVYLHEALSFLAPILALAVVSQYSKVSGVNKILFILLLIWFCFISAVDLNFIINPRSESNKSGFLSQLLELKWLYWAGYNITSILGGLSLVCMMIISLIKFTKAPDIFRYITWGVVGLFGIICLFSVFLVATDFSVYGVITQFAARANSALISFPLALLALLLLYKPYLEKKWSNVPNVLILGFLAAAVFSSHAIGIYQWSEYIKDYRLLISHDKGIISRAEALETLTPQQHLNFLKMEWVWTNPIMSFLLSEKGNVSTIILNSSGASWEPFDACNTKELPKSKFFNTQYIINTLQKRGCSK